MISFKCSQSGVRPSWYEKTITCFVSVLLRCLFVYSKNASDGRPGPEMIVGVFHNSRRETKHKNANARKATGIQNNELGD